MSSIPTGCDKISRFRLRYRSRIYNIYDAESKYFAVTTKPSPRPSVHDVIVIRSFAGPRYQRVMVRRRAMYIFTKTPFRPVPTAKISVLLYNDVVYCDFYHYFIPMRFSRSVGRGLAVLRLVIVQIALRYIIDGIF